MQVGYFAMPLHPPGSNQTQTLDHDLEQIVTLDQLGYKEAWIGEHFTAAWENIPAPDLFIAAAIPMTKHIVLGTGVSCMPNHNPFMIAHGHLTIVPGALRARSTSPRPRSRHAGRPWRAC